MKQKLIIFLGILIVIIVGISIFNSNLITTNDKKITPKPRELPKEVSITLDKNGFSPKEITIKTGTAVRWKNISGKKQTVNSDDYPTNQKHKELNFGIFENNSSFVYTFSKPGTYGYHNQFNSKQAGKIIVEK